MTLLLLICLATMIMGVGFTIVFIGSRLLGRPLSKGCGKTDCCQKRSCDKQTLSDSVTTVSPHDNTNSPYSS